MKKYKISEKEGKVISEKIKKFEEFKGCIKMVKIYVYLKSGVVDVYSVESVSKAREHAWQIWQTGYRMRIDGRIEWFGPHWLDKICWDVPEEDYESKKYPGMNFKGEKYE